MANTIIQRCIDIKAISQVLSCYMQDPSLTKNYKLKLEDLSKGIYFMIYEAIVFLYNAGTESISPKDIADYYSKDKMPIQYSIFTKNKGLDYLSEIIKFSRLENFAYYYNIVKKYSLLRSLVSNGIDISDFFDPDEEDPSEIENKRNLLEENSIDFIIQHYRNKIIQISSNFSSEDSNDSKKAGVGGLEQLEKWKQNIAYGLSYPSKYLTQVAHGLRQKTFTVMSAGTGVGKTRISVANLCYSFVPRFFVATERDKDGKILKGKWQVNPNGTKNCAMYIGTEMELLEEIEPILWAYIANVPEEHIKFNKYEDGEEDRVKTAIKILEKEANIFLEYIPDYDINKLEKIIDKRVTQDKVTHVFFDYIHTTVDLISEYSMETKVKMSVREDQVLANLSNKLKELCRKYNVSLNTWTQVSGDFKNDQNRDQTIVRGAKAIIDKADIAAIVSIPSIRELEKLKYILQKEKDFSNPDRKNDKEHTLPPNVCISIYKNRGGKYNNIKIWLYVDYDTMRIHDRFVTDYDYKTFKDSVKLEGLNGKYVYVREDENLDENKDHHKDGFSLSLSDTPVEAKWNNEFSENFLTTNAQGELEQLTTDIKEKAASKKIKTKKVEEDLNY